MNNMKELDVHRQLFTDQFHVYMPYSATVSKKELHEYGVVGFHSKESLEQYLSDIILVKATIVQIATVTNQGEEVSLYDARDAATMYDLIVQHLENWLTIGQQHLASRLPPLGDLMALDDLAGVLHPHVVVEDGPSTTVVDYALGDDLLLGMMGGVVREKTRGYQPYTPLFIELGTPEH